MVNGETIAAKLTLGALVELEDRIGSKSLVDLVERFEEQAFSAKDVLAVLFVGCRAGGWAGTFQEFAASEIGKGPLDAAKSSAELLVRAFALPDSGGGAL